MPTWELTEDIEALFSLLSTAALAGVNQYDIYDAKDNEYDYDAVTDDINDSHSLSCEYKESVDNNLSDKVAEDLVEAWKERMDLMVDYSKPYFTNI